MSKWNSFSAENTIDRDIQQLQQKLKNRLMEAKLEGREMSFEQFEKFQKEVLNLTRENLKRFYKNKQQIRESAKYYFNTIESNANKAEETKGEL